MKLVKFPKGPATEENDATRIAKELYQACRDGTITDFVAVGIQPNNDTTMWLGASQHKSILELLGAVDMLWRHAYEILEEQGENGGGA